MVVGLTTCCENNKFTTSVYRKATFIEVFTNFKSFMPIVSKVVLVYTLLHRFFNSIFSYLSGYPIPFIDR